MNVSRLINFHLNVEISEHLRGNSKTSLTTVICCVNVDVFIG